MYSLDEIEQDPQDVRLCMFVCLRSCASVSLCFCAFVGDDEGLTVRVTVPLLGYSNCSHNLNALP